MEKNHYELLYIVSMKHIEDELQIARDAVNSLIKDKGGEITMDEVWCRQRLAYPIKKVHQGTYIAVEFDIEKDKIKELDKQLKIMPEILRHLIVSKRVRSAEEIEKEKKQRQPIEERSSAAAADSIPPAEEAAAPVVTAAPPAKPAAAKKPAVEVKQKPEKEKATLEDLDKKLDEILTEEIL